MRASPILSAVEAEADVILLDNMDPDMLRDAVARINDYALVEASGGITIRNIREVAESGVDMISCGFITHSAGSRDISLNVVVDK